MPFGDCNAMGNWFLSFVLCLEVEIGEVLQEQRKQLCTVSPKACLMYAIAACGKYLPMDVCTWRKWRQRWTNFFLEQQSYTINVTKTDIDTQEVCQIQFRACVLFVCPTFLLKTFEIESWNLAIFNPTRGSNFEVYLKRRFALQIVHLKMLVVPNDELGCL